MEDIRQNLKLNKDAIAAAMKDLLHHALMAEAEAARKLAEQADAVEMARLASEGYLARIDALTKQAEAATTKRGK